MKSPFFELLQMNSKYDTFPFEVSTSTFFMHRHKNVKAQETKDALQNEANFKIQEPFLLKNKMKKLMNFKCKIIDDEVHVFIQMFKYFCVSQLSAMDYFKSIDRI